MRASSSLLSLILLVTLTACHPSADPAAPPPAPAPAREPIAMTYLGVAGWQLDAAGKTILIDPYFTRPDLDVDAPIAPDPAAIDSRAPARADLIVVGHSHIDHLLDTPAVALATGATVMGSVSTARVALASGVPADRVIAINGGEDLAFDGFSARVIPSLHSMIGMVNAEIPANPSLPMRFADYAEGGTYAYLVRIAGHEILLLSTANFIERELDGLRPDIAVIATGLRHKVHDYTCRLMRALGHPLRVFANHFDDWRGPPVDEPLSDDLRAFIDEVARCSPATKVVIPSHFERMEISR